MDEPNEKKGIGKGNNEAGNTSIDFDKEFTTSFNKALLYAKLATTALEYVYNTNPARVVLKDLDILDDKQKSECKERVSGMMQTWLTQVESTLREGTGVPVDIIGQLADIARKDRARHKTT